MENIWLQGIVENYSFLKLAQNILPKTEFEVMSYPYSSALLMPGMEEYREKCIPRFHYVTREEEEAIRSGKWLSSKNYESQDMPYGFYFVDLPLQDVERYFKCWFCNKQVDKLIKPFYVPKDGVVLFSKRLLTTAVFIILHEFGHYLDYKKFESKNMYAKWVYDSKKPLRDYDEKIKELSITQEITEANVNEREEIYRQCEDEQLADQYALRNLYEKVAEALRLIISTDP